MIYTQKKILCASLCGADAKLSCIGAFSLVEDSLTELMGELEIDGLTVMDRYNGIWIINKNHMQFIKPIDWKEQITVESYIVKKTFIRLCADICIKNGKDDVSVYSRIELCGIDKESGSIRKTETLGVDDSILSEPAQSEIAFFAKDDVEKSLVDSTVVRASNIDYVHHTNNIEYIRFLINTFSFEQLLKKPIKEIEVRYLNPSFEGDRLDIYQGKLPDRAVFEIVKGDTEIMKCDMRF